MIAPRSAVDETALELLYDSQFNPVSDVLFWIEEFEKKLEGAPTEDGVSREVAGLTLIRYLGSAEVYMANSVDVDYKAFNELLRRFQDLIERKSAQIEKILCEEIRENLGLRCKRWSQYVRKVIDRLDLPDFMDVQEELFNRDKLRELMNLADGDGQVRDHFDSIAVADQLYRQNVEPYFGFLSDSLKVYFPTGEFWWMYSKPIGLTLENPFAEKGGQSNLNSPP